MSTPLFIDDKVRRDIKYLIQMAEANPVDMLTLTARLEDRKIKMAHMKQMTAQTIFVPVSFWVTYSIETGHPIGTCRHMSMSIDRQGRVPSPIAVWVVAQEFGFRGSLKQCTVWQEKLQGHGQAIDVVQPLDYTAPSNKS